MKTAYLASKPRYEILDGLRGVAAMMVVAFHLFETYYHMGPDQPLNHGYLAVDFFFVLSGFVIGYAYDDRWKKPHPQPLSEREGSKYLTLATFFKRRLVRLHPMLVFGTFVGLLFFYMGDGHPDFSRIADVPWWMVLVVFLLGCTMLPAPAALDIRGWGEFNPLNGATWSLLWEYVANVLYALFIRRFSMLVLTAFVLISAVLTVVLCMNIDVTGFLSMRDYAAYTVVGGWSLTPDQLQVGLTRLLYPFFCGLLLSRCFAARQGLARRLGVKGGFWWCSLAIVVLLAMPRVGGAEPGNYWMNGLYEAVCILALFPLLVALGAASGVRGRRSERVCRFLGDISYPLYVTHYPLIYLQMSWAATHQHLPVSTHVFFAVVIFILAIGISYASLRLYDLPVRAWLRRKLFSTAA